LRTVFPPRTRPGRFVLYICSFAIAALYVVHAGFVNTTPYIDLSQWLSGHERLPFQKRALLIPLLRAFDHSPAVQHFAKTRSFVLAQPVKIGLVVIDFLSLLGCGFLATRIYDRATHSGRLRWAPSALMLVLYVFTAGFRYESNFIFPYDMLSMFFFTLGIYLIQRNKIWMLFILFPIATLNRETTLMWAPVLLLAGRYRAKFSCQPHRVWIKTALTTTALVLMWFAMMHFINGRYPHNDRSEDFPRIFYNIRLLFSPKDWDQLLSLFAFTLPFALLSWRKIDDGLLRNIFPIVPLWVALMFYQGVIIEGRIFSELLPYYAVVSVLIFEHIYLVYPAADALEEEEADTQPVFEEATLWPRLRAMQFKVAAALSPR
jgi:hypothetical protein